MRPWPALMRLPADVELRTILFTDVNIYYPNILFVLPRQSRLVCEILTGSCRKEQRRFVGQSPTTLGRLIVQVEASALDEKASSPAQEKSSFHFCIFCRIHFSCSHHGRSIHSRSDIANMANNATAAAPADRLAGLAHSEQHYFNR